MEFIKRALAPGVDVAALSIPRDNGKSWLAAHLLERALTPGDDLFVSGSEYLLCAGSIEPGMAPPGLSGGRAAVSNFRQTDDVTPLSDTHAV